MKKQILKIATTSILISIVFVVEEALSFIPNVQLTVLFFTLYGAYCGPKWGSVIVIIHTLLDCLVAGSFVPYVIIPMMLGWEIVLLFGYFFRHRSLFIITLMAGIGSIIYTLMFAVTNALFLHVNFFSYLLADIIFDIILFGTSVLSVLWLYQPLLKVLKKKDVYEIE